MHGLPQSGSMQLPVDGTPWQDQKSHGTEAQGALYASIAPDPPQASLARALEAEIIPRLVLAHQREQRPSDAAVLRGLAMGRVGATDVEAFVESVLAGDTVSDAGLVGALRSTGASLESLCTELLTPAARRLGDLWNADLCDFAQITMALWRLQQLLREFGPQFPTEIASRNSGLRALLVPAPGEEHTLGLAMVTEFFRRAGWRVSGSPPASIDQLRQMASADWFDVAGLAISCETRLRLLAQSIRTLRRASRNPAIRVLVGGPLFAQRPELVALVGADATSTDARYAPAQAEQLLALLGPGRRTSSG
jgi:MerR family transcriptional regulator, light-induced transcriptional regulator